MRSADTIASRSAIADHGATSSGTGFMSKRAMKRAARSIRNGSSEKLISGASGVRKRAGHQVDGAAVRIDEHRGRRASSAPAPSR